MGVKVKKVRADMILRQIAKRHNGRVPDAFFTEVKNGPTIAPSRHELLRLDAVAFKKSWVNPCITGYEIKVDRQDFLRDDKWPGYQKYCHRLFFACPVGLITRDELPGDVGLIYYNPENDCISTKRAASFRAIEIPWEMLYYLVISRSGSDRHPFFSSQREFLEAWVQDKEERRELAYEVNTKLVQKLDEANRKATRINRKLESLQEDLDLLKRIEEVLNRHGIRTYRWALEKDLEEALSRGMAPDMRQGLERISEEVSRLMGTVSKSVSC